MTRGRLPRNDREEALGRNGKGLRWGEMTEGGSCIGRRMVCSERNGRSPQEAAGRFIV